MDPQPRAEELLYDGESVRERVGAGSGRVVVTSHRVLVFSPEGDGANFRAVDRPNVTELRAETQGDAAQLRRAAVAGAGGLAALTLGLLLDFDSLVSNGGLDVAGGNAAGIGGLLETIETLLRIVALLDDLLVAGGLAVLLAATVLGGVCWTRREPTLTVAVAGDDDVKLAWGAGDRQDEHAAADADATADDADAAADDAEGAADRLRRALST